MPRDGHSWTDAEMLLALDMFDNEGLSARAIAANFGVTRNAVIGKLAQIRKDDALVRDAARKPENRDGGMPRLWWMNGLGARE